MKINAEIFLEKSDQHKLINNIILISGNEFGLISKIQENTNDVMIILFIRNYHEYFNHDM